MTSATFAMVAAFGWLIVANLIAMTPSKDYHWSNAYKLIAVFIPIFIWVAMTNGFLWAAAFALGASSVLRYPVLYFWRWVRARLGL